MSAYICGDPGLVRLVWIGLNFLLLNELLGNFLLISSHETAGSGAICAVTLFYWVQLFVEARISASIWFIIGLGCCTCFFVCWWTTSHLAISWGSGVIVSVFNTIEACFFIKGDLLSHSQFSLAWLTNYLIGNQQFSTVSLLLAWIPFDFSCSELSFRAVVSCIYWSLSSLRMR